MHIQSCSPVNPCSLHYDSVLALAAPPCRAGMRVVQTRVHCISVTYVSVSYFACLCMRRMRARVRRSYNTSSLASVKYRCLLCVRYARRADARALCACVSACLAGVRVGAGVRDICRHQAGDLAGRASGDGAEGCCTAAKAKAAAADAGKSAALRRKRRWRHERRRARRRGEGCCRRSTQGRHRNFSVSAGAAGHANRAASVVRTPPALLKAAASQTATIQIPQPPAPRPPARAPTAPTARRARR